MLHLIHQGKEVHREALLFWLEMFFGKDGADLFLHSPIFHAKNQVFQEFYLV